MKKVGLPSLLTLTSCLACDGGDAGPATVPSRFPDHSVAGTGDAGGACSSGWIERSGPMRKTNQIGGERKPISSEERP